MLIIRTKTGFKMNSLPELSFEQIFLDNTHFGSNLRFIAKECLDNYKSSGFDFSHVLTIGSDNSKDFLTGKLFIQS